MSTAPLARECLRNEAAPVTRVDALVIGAGPAGLAVGACLRSDDIPFLMLEAGERLGESWHTRYDRLHLHTVKRYSALPFMPFPDSYPRYPSGQQVVEYLEAYARCFDLQPRFGQPVISAHFQDGCWHTTTHDSRYVSRYLIVCTGFNRQPNLPSWPGQQSFRGPIVHSADYRSGESFRGQRVLVVGLGNSGGEIAVDLWEHGVDTSIAVRGGVNIVPRDPFGIPIQVLSIFSPSLSPRTTDALMRPLWRHLVGDLRPHGLRSPSYGPLTGAATLGRIPVIDVGTVQLLKGGHVRIFGEIDRLTADGVVFKDGKEAQFDAVVLATGFRPALDSFLVDVRAVTDSRKYPCEYGRRTSLPGLYFCGFHNVATGLLREIGREAIWIARDIAENRSQPF